MSRHTASVAPLLRAFQSLHPPAWIDLLRGLAEGEIAEFEFRILQPNGAYRWLLDHGADPDVRCDRELRETSLHVAARVGQAPRVVELLLDHGADVHARRADGRSPWLLARRGERLARTSLGGAIPGKLVKTPVGDGASAPSAAAAIWYRWIPASRRAGR